MCRFLSTKCSAHRRWIEEMNVDERWTHNVNRKQITAMSFLILLSFPHPVVVLVLCLSVLVHHKCKWHSNPSRRMNIEMVWRFGKLQSKHKMTLTENIARFCCLSFSLTYGDQTGNVYSLYFRCTQHTHAFDLDERQRTKWYAVPATYRKTENEMRQSIGGKQRLALTTHSIHWLHLLTNNERNKKVFPFSQTSTSIRSIFSLSAELRELRVCVWVPAMRRKWPITFSRKRSW